MSLERNKYPKNNLFSLKQNYTKYTYNIINEGHYPSKNTLCYTSTHSSIKAQYKIPDGYLVETSWRRGKSKHKVECEIEYESDGPVFRIRFEENSQQYTIESKESISKVGNEYL
ncbi:15149_t:CDS:1 [Cetraspora pellucida]|uniref:15149_t:CDS:1 n=1 Tax=Cetraspora pellucida TaxID=1433469 RepID=A0ACA9L6M3_9GLOM|nr:15149_t:CDS:1 [Cetraspora pellucida]